MEILLGTLGFVLIAGLLIKWGRDNARREQEYLDSLLSLVDQEKRRDASG